MSSQSHIINKVVLELDTGQIADVCSLQEDMSRLIWQQALPQMEMLFDRLVGEDEVVRLDQVTVELKSIDPQFLGDEFIRNLVNALEQSLNDHLSGYQPTEVVASRERLNQPSTNAEIFLYFLRYGRLPWWSVAQSWENWLMRWQTAFENDQGWQIRFRELLASDRTVKYRLIAQFPDSFRHQLILQLQPTWVFWRSLLSQSHQLMQGLNLSRRSVEFLNRQAWSLIFALLSQSRASHPLPAATWSRQWLTQILILWLQENASDRVFRSQFSSETLLPSVTETPSLLDLSPDNVQFLETLITTTSGINQSLWQTALSQVLATQAGSQAKLDASPPGENNLDHSELSNPDVFSDHSPTETSERLTGEKFPGDEVFLDVEEEVTGLYLNQAGLVLLHPFLRAYFDDVGLLTEGHFRDSACQQIGIYLLYYLATRQTDPPEYELVLPKLLCGWPLNEPVERGFDLPETALAEAENLLQAAIDYWEVLKSTSPDGLREGFLQREGRLTRIDLGWKLRVEQKSIDILLSRLPWGISMVKLPWMNELLTVEWI